VGGIDVPAAAFGAGTVNDLRDSCQPDGAADRAASAARTLAAIAHDAARKYVKRDAVTSETDRDYAKVMAWSRNIVAAHDAGRDLAALDTAERERQARLRRWHELPHPNRKGR
jgi:hypothetical protein